MCRIEPQRRRFNSVPGGVLNRNGSESRGHPFGPTELLNENPRLCGPASGDPPNMRNFGRVFPSGSLVPTSVCKLKSCAPGRRSSIRSNMRRNNSPGAATSAISTAYSGREHHIAPILITLSRSRAEASRARLDPLPLTGQAVHALIVHGACAAAHPNLSPASRAALRIIATSGSRWPPPAAPRWRSPKRRSRRKPLVFIPMKFRENAEIFSSYRLLLRRLWQAYASGGARFFRLRPRSLIRRQNLKARFLRTL